MTVYKVVLDIMERYYEDFDRPLFKKYRDELIPFAKAFYKMMNKNNIE